MDDVTGRLGLPLLAPGQAGKEIAHNEALARLAMLVQPVVVAAGVDDPPAAPVAGQAWIVGAAPTGAWRGEAQAIAGWTDGGWRFAAAEEGMTAWVAAADLTARFAGGAWQIGDVRGARLVIDGQPSVGPAQTAPDTPAGGTNIDAESRSSIAAILTILRYHGLIV